MATTQRKLRVNKKQEQEQVQVQVQEQEQPVVEKKERRERREKKLKMEPIIEEEPVVEEVPEFEDQTLNVDVEPVAVDEVENVENTLTLMISQTENLFKMFREHSHTLKKLSVLYKKELKNLNKKKKTKETNLGKKPRKHPERVMTDALCDLMEKPKGSKSSRNAVHSFLCGYIKKNSLQCVEDKKCFVPDGPLDKVLGKPRLPAHLKNPELMFSYTNLMGYLSDLFVPLE